MADRWTEPGRSVSESGRIQYDWPPKGRFAALWARLQVLLPTDTDKSEALSLLRCWWDDTATLVAYQDPETGEWMDVEPDWSLVDQWRSEGE